MPGEEQEALLLEHRTWQLLRAVYEYAAPFFPSDHGEIDNCRNQLHRADPEFVPISSEQMLRENPYITPGDLSQLIVNEDDDLSLWAVRAARRVFSRLAESLRHSLTTYNPDPFSTGLRPSKPDTVTSPPPCAAPRPRG
jgi:hypothetical protein